MDGRPSAIRQGRLLMAATDQPSPWWSASRHADRKPFLMARAAITAPPLVVRAQGVRATVIGGFSFGGKPADPFAEPELLTVAAAFEQFGGIDLLATIADGEADRAALAAAAGGLVRIADDDTW